MGQVACCSLVFFTLSCYVQCQLVQFVRESDLDFRNLSSKGLLTSESDWNSLDRDQQFHPAASVPRALTLSRSWLLSTNQSSHNGRRMRRQAFYTKKTNAIGGAFSWSHYFTITPTNNVNSKESAYIGQENLKRLKNLLEKGTGFQFLSPTGLSITIPGNSFIQGIEDFRLKLNEEFGSNDGGHYAPQGYKSGSSWTYDVPQLKVKQGDKVYYWMQVKLGDEGFNTMVRGVLDIRQGDPHQASNTIRNPSLPVFSRPQTPVAPPVGQGGGQRGQQAGKWEYEYNFSIDTTYNTDFTQASDDRWHDDVQLFKNTLEKDIKFVFFNPTGLSISIPGDNEDVKILTFNVKLNEEFTTLGPGQYMPNMTRTRDGWLNYYFPNLKLRQGDKAYFWMHVTLGKQAFDNIVKGVLQVTQGDPHIADTAPMSTAPLTPLQSLPNSPSQYPPPTPPNKQPSQTFPIRYPPPSPPIKQPTKTTSGQYPPEPVPPQQNPNKYPSEPNQPCNPSLSSRNGESSPPCQGEVMFEHKFNTMDGWTHQVTIGGDYPEDDFTCYTKFNENAWVQQGKLYIKPTLLEDRANDSFVRSGELTLDGCTSDISQQCQRRAQAYSILPPIHSARINTENKFTFRYGTVEIRAKLPQGDWIVPELWLRPTSTYVRERVVMGLTRGNSGNTGNMLGAGVDRISDKKQSLVNIMGPRPWFQGFHNFRMEWTPDNVRFSVDNQQINSLPTNSFAILSQEVYFSLGVHAGGSRDFPDDMFPNRPWSNTDVKRILRFWNSKKDWYGTWRNDPTLQVEYVRVTAL